MANPGQFIVRQKTHRIFVVILFLAALASWVDTPALADAPLATQPAPVSIVPWPRSLTMQQGQLALTAKSRIVAADASLEGLAAILSQEIEQTCNLRLATASGDAGAGDISIALDPSLKGENYVLQITQKNATVRGANYNAVAMGTVTLLQSLKVLEGNVSAPALTVNDEPQSAYCGTMVDVARRFNSIDSLKQIVLMCRLYKIRFLHLHMTDDQAWTFPSKAYPKLGTTPGFLAGGKGPAPYTLEELTGLVKFADDRGVTIVPEIEMPGHSYALQRDLPDIFGIMNPKTGKKSGCGVINIINPEAYTALDTIIGEVCDVFKSSPYYHMGGDECDWSGFVKSSEYQDYAKSTGLTHRQMIDAFVHKINEMVKKRGKRLISWESDGNTIDKDIVIMAWRAGHDEMIKQGYQIINVPWVPQVGYTPRANYEWNIWMVGPEGVKRPSQMPQTPEIVKGVLGAQQVLWQQTGDNTLRMLRITAPARNEQTYNPYAARGYPDFAERMKHTDDLLDKLAEPVRISVVGLRKMDGPPVEDVSDTWGPNNHLFVEYGGNVIFDDHLTVTIEPLINEAGETIHYTLDGTEPTAQSMVYTAPFTLAPSAEQIKQAEGHEPRIDMTIRARLYVGDKAISFDRLARYSYNMLEHARQTWKMTIYQTDKKLKRAPDDLASMKPVYAGTTSTMLLSDIRYINFPPNIVCVWEGTANMKEDADYNFKLRSFGATSQLFIDGKQVIDRTDEGWNKEDFGKAHLSAGKHNIKVVRVGGAGYQSLNLMLPDNKTQKPLDWDTVTQ